MYKFRSETTTALISSTIRSYYGSCHLLVQKQEGATHTQSNLPKENWERQVGYTFYSLQTYLSSSPPLLLEGNGGSGPTHLRDAPNPRWKSLCRWAQTQWWKSTRDDPKPLSANGGNLLRDSPNPRVEMVEITSKMVPNPLMEITSEMAPNPMV